MKPAIKKYRLDGKAIYKNNQNVNKYKKAYTIIKIIEVVIILSIMGVDYHKLGATGVIVAIAIAAVIGSIGIAFIAAPMILAYFIAVIGVSMALAEKIDGINPYITEKALSCVFRSPDSVRKEISMRKMGWSKITDIREIKGATDETEKRILRASVFAYITAATIIAFFMDR